MNTTAAIIICTHNRANSLRRTLTSLTRLAWPGRVAWTVLVVNNACTDETQAVVQEFMDRLPLQYREHPRPGKWGALNAAIQDTEADLILLTDDDVDPDDAWAEEIMSAVQRHPECDLFGGKIIPVWPGGQPPPWVLEHQDKLLAGVTVNFDLGSEERRIGLEEAFYGANMAVRARVFSDGYRFPDAVGPRGGERAPHGETGLIRQLLQDGRIALYVPTAVVSHRNSAYRATERWIRAWYKGHGVSTVRLEGDGDMSRAWFGAPRYLWRKCFTHAFHYAWSRRTAPSAVWLRHEMAMCTAWGAICEHRRQKRLERLGEGSRSRDLH